MNNNNRTVLVPRPEGRAQELTSALKQARYEPEHHPFIEFAFAPTPLVTGFTSRLSAGEFAHLVVTSATTVQALTEPPGTCPPSPSTSVVAVGAATAQALSEAGIEADHVAEGSGVALVDSFPRYQSGGRRIAYPVSAQAGPTLAAGLGQLGWDVERFNAYRPVPAPLPTGLPTRILAGDFHAILLTSPYIADLILDLQPAAGTELIAIGDPTAKRILDRGYTVSAQASDPSVNGLLSALHAADTQSSKAKEH